MVNTQITFLSHAPSLIVVVIFHWENSAFQELNPPTIANFGDPESYEYEESLGP